MAQRTMTDPYLTEEQSISLTKLLNMIIPPNDVKGLPGAGELDFVGYVREFDPNQLEAVQKELDLLNNYSKSQFKRIFSDLDQKEREYLVDRLRNDNKTFAQSITFQTMACYYQDDNVMRTLGMDSRPPFPKGNEVVSGDLNLLDPVRKKQQIFRYIPRDLSD